MENETEVKTEETNPTDENQKQEAESTEEPKAKKQKVVDRKEICPFMLRVFVKLNKDWR